MADTTVFDNLPRNYATICIDGRGLLWNATEFALKKFPEVSSMNERYTTILWCLFERLSYPITQFNTNKLVWAWESPTSKRTELFPDYKLRRQSEVKPGDSEKVKAYKLKNKEKNAELDKLKPFWLEIQKNIIPMLGFRNSFELDGLEGDDIIAQICRQEKRAPMIIFSEDGDMYQCIKQNVACMSVRVMRITADGQPSKPRLLDRKRFIKLKGIEPERWADAKAIGGCRTDGVPGIVGVSVDTAIKYLNDPATLLRKDGKPNARLTAILNGSETIAFTDKLVRLPFEGTPNITLRQDELNKAAFLKLCQLYKLSSLVSDFWVDFFSGK